MNRKLYMELAAAVAVALALLVGFIVVSQSLQAAWVDHFDRTVGEAVRGMRSDGLTPVAKFFTSLGTSKVEGAVCLAIALLLMFRLKHRWETLILIVGVLGTWGLNTLLKSVFGRARPELALRLVEETGFSFPSGHSMVSMLFYGLAGYLLWYEARGVWRAAWLIPLVTMLVVLCIGCSRIYLGVHYPSDVLAGFAAGGACLAACIMAVRAVRYRRGVKSGVGK
ncbi:phosphatase PAP2 family protein [Paenibacillus athensensis]|uniref:phosphatase PAP2 family protein n=1 Tax=Paenibacillus athensensis TaxID=1967502 RepID=UPI001430235E|nr:phosphatase PAP2 family protein [Paenibacillus athensensis]MCD1260564.1 phosphatase PAP2 family protein [Paenibacillus athensensis]